MKSEHKWSAGHLGDSDVSRLSTCVWITETHFKTKCKQPPCLLAGTCGTYLCPCTSKKVWMEPCARTHDYTYSWKAWIGLKADVILSMSVSMRGFTWRKFRHQSVYAYALCRLPRVPQVGPHAHNTTINVCRSTVHMWNTSSKRTSESSINRATMHPWWWSVYVCSGVYLWLNAHKFVARVAEDSTFHVGLYNIGKLSWICIFIT